MHPTFVTQLGQERAAEIAHNVERLRLLRWADPHLTRPGAASLLHRVRSRLGGLAAPSRRPDRRPSSEPAAKMHADGQRG